MSDTSTIDAPAGSDSGVDLAEYVERAYLDYAMSVVMGRALPRLQDGQKPVQRRILYAMHRMGLTDKTKHVKSARVVGDVLGKYHAHGDSSVYDAAVRMSQNFSLRYPLIDGQGNFGDRDGSGAAAMRYTEARLTPIAELLLGELDQGTVDFGPNYDGTLQEPLLLPARLPMLLLNGASGIAVGMATEVPSHNLVEVAKACELLIRTPTATLDDVLNVLPAPDFPCGAQIISSPEEIAKAYSTGRGSFRVRARWTVEPLARGQWQIAVHELPPGTSTAHVMAEIEALTNPQVKAGKKTLTQDQTNLKALVLSVVDKISDDSDGEHPVRLIIEPKSSRQSPDEVMQILLANTSLEGSAPLNLVTIGQDAKPQQKGLMQVLAEWIDFRFETVRRRIRHRLEQLRARLHILSGRMKVYVNLDDVINIIRMAEDAKLELMSRYKLSEVRALDILEIRLRQLANMEYIKLESEMTSLRKEEAELQEQLDNPASLKKTVLQEISADSKKYGDPRRTLVEAAAKVTVSQVASAADDPVTLVVSKQGWLRARTGHKVDLSTLTWKPGDEALAVIEARSNQTVAFWDDSGRVYNVAASAFPTGRGDGVPLTSLVELSAPMVQVALLEPGRHYFLSNTGGYGFVCTSDDLMTRQKAGKVVMTLDGAEKVLAPVALPNLSEHGELAFATSSGKLLVCKLSEMKVMPKGRGNQLVALSAADTLTSVCGSPEQLAGLAITTSKGAQLTLQGTKLEPYRGKRARAGLALPHKAVAVSLTESAN